VAEYLKQGYEGPFYHRMIETVLSRDKNWARWKVENCPSIARPAISADDYAKAKVLANREFNHKRRKIDPNPPFSVPLDFLDEGKNIDRLKNSKRYELKPLSEYKDSIELDDLNMDFEVGEQKQILIEAKASKSWRALRTATTTKLVAFDKIDRSDKIEEIFKDDPKPEEPIANTEDEPEAMDIDTPTDRRLVIISGPSGVGKGTLVTMLMEKHPKVFGKKASHTTRAPREGEVHGQHYYFVNKEEYDVLRDGDQFLEYNNFNGNDYGTSRKVVKGIIAQGKVPLMEMDYHVSLDLFFLMNHSLTPETGHPTTQGPRIPLTFHLP
jgi:THO complex subunit 1